MASKFRRTDVFITCWAADVLSRHSQKWMTNERCCGNQVMSVQSSSVYARTPNTQIRESEISRALRVLLVIVLFTIVPIVDSHKNKQTNKNRADNFPGFVIVSINVIFLKGENVCHI